MSADLPNTRAEYPAALDATGDVYRADDLLVRLKNFVSLHTMKILQQAIRLRERRRGFHLITREVLEAVPEIGQIRKGLCQVFIRHTSASLTIGENADPTVRVDFETFFNKAVPENDPDYRHNDEGPDDMPAHLKSALLGCSVLIPITDGELALGTWQGIYLCEHRDHGGSRDLVVTCWGDN